MAAIEKSVDRFLKKGKLDEKKAREIVGRVESSRNLEDFGDIPLVMEAVVERIDIRRQVFQTLDEITPATTLLATKTSSSSITEIGATTNRPERVIGMHFMNPVPIMTLVEVIRGQDTSDETTAAVMACSRAIGKTPVEVDDYPGFVSNRVLMPMINEAIFCLMEGVATRESIDTVMKLAMNHPMGPLVLADPIGLDVCLDILEVLHQGLGDPKCRPCPPLRRISVPSGPRSWSQGGGLRAFGLHELTNARSSFLAWGAGAHRKCCGPSRRGHAERSGRPPPSRRLSNGRILRPALSEREPRLRRWPRGSHSRRFSRKTEVVRDDPDDRGER